MTTTRTDKKVCMRNISPGFAEVWRDGYWNDSVWHEAEHLGSVTDGHARYGRNGVWFCWMNGDGKAYGSRAAAVRALGEATR